MPRRITYLYLLLIPLLSACSGAESVQNNNVAYLYNPNELSLKSHFVVEHLNDTLSRLHYRFDSENLLYVREGVTKNYLADFAISYQVMPSFTSRMVLDSARFLFSDQVPEPASKVISGHLDLKTPVQDSKQKTYLVLAKFTDRNRGMSYQNLVHLDKSSLNEQQYFLLRDTANRLIFKPQLTQDIPFRLEHPSLQPRRYFVSLYQRDFPVALPPYSNRDAQSFELEPDSVFSLTADAPIQLKEEGFYHFRLDTTQWRGFTVYSFAPSFPLVGRPQQLAAPLRYLTTQDEFNAYLAVKNDPVKVKRWVDDFWRSRASTGERAKALIAAFYQRVEEANRQFSSYLEGWKTDRGIMYIIYGPPNKVYRSDEGETWVYGNESSILSYAFRFTKIDNPFSNNDFELERNKQYRYGWGQAIEAWRNGHIYNSKDIRREQDEQDAQAQYRNRPPYWN